MDYRIDAYYLFKKTRKQGSQRTNCAYRFVHTENSTKFEIINNPSMVLAVHFKKMCIDALNVYKN